ncbi:MAG TPA: hypothetical protein VG265_03195 [Gaiellaceae bacterium]|jgi:hypothetical protein|nr:hypothetical protein [Gaiellaceae bacterium]
MPAGTSEALAEETLAGSLTKLCRGGSWQGLAREIAWRAVTGGSRDPRSVEHLSASAEAMLAELIDEALWEVERCAICAWEEHLEEHRSDTAGALAVARLDAGEEAARLVAAAYDQVLDTLLARSSRAA